MYYQANIHSLRFKKDIPINYIRKIKWGKHSVELRRGKNSSILWPKDDIAYITTIDQRRVKSPSKVTQEEIKKLTDAIKKTGQ
ncbi:MAG: hypothetical protein KGY70_18435 [Bacteroidales bacterium]|nr:hypothetical protein [Bacteroidales bacterium]